MSDATGPATVEINMQDLAHFVAGISRFLAGLASMAPFSETGLGLAEWSTLSIVAGRENVRTAQLAASLGVSGQRMNQILDSLQAAALVSVVAAEENPRRRSIVMTPAGNEKLEALNSRLRPIVVSALRTRPQALSRANRMVNKILFRIVSPGKRAEPEKTNS
jgi:DNA-binding MarR family transcriptional regulator